MNVVIEHKIRRLNYVGDVQTQYNALDTVLQRGIKSAKLREAVLENLPTELYEELIQLEFC